MCAAVMIKLSTAAKRIFRMAALTFVGVVAGNHAGLWWLPISLFHNSDVQAIDLGRINRRLFLGISPEQTLLPKKSSSLLGKDATLITSP